MKRKKGYAGKKKMEIREGKERKDISDLVMRYTKPVRDAINEEGKGKSAPLGADREVHGLGISAEFSDEVENYIKCTPFYFGVDYGVGATEEVAWTPVKETHTETQSDEHTTPNDAEKSDGVWVTPFHFVNRKYLLDKYQEEYCLRSPPNMPFPSDEALGMSISARERGDRVEAVMGKREMARSENKNSEDRTYLKYDPSYDELLEEIKSLPTISLVPSAPEERQKRRDYFMDKHSPKDPPRTPSLSEQVRELENQVKATQKEAEIATASKLRLLRQIENYHVEHGKFIEEKKKQAAQTAEEIETYKKRIKGLERTVESLCNELNRLYQDYAACRKEHMMARAIPDFKKISEHHMSEMQSALGASNEQKRDVVEAQHINLAVNVLPFSQKAPMEEKHPELFIKPDGDVWILMMAFIFVVFVLSGLAIYSSRIKENAAEKVETVTPYSAPTPRIFPPFIEKEKVPSICKKPVRR